MKKRFIEEQFDRVVQETQGGRSGREFWTR
jgi:hypothetical protein